MSENLDEIEKSASLCTLCVLETCGCADSDRSSLYFSPPILTPNDESNYGNSKHDDELRLFLKDAGRTNYLSNKFNDNAIFDRIKKNIAIEKEFFDSRNHADKQQNNNNNHKDYNERTSNFDDSDDADVVELSRSYRDLLKRLDNAGNIRSLDKLSQEDEQDRGNNNSLSQKSIISSSSDTLSLELGIAPKISIKNNNNQPINDADGVTTENPKNVDHSSGFEELETKVPACEKLSDTNNTNLVNNENPVSTLNPTDEPARCYDSSIRDDEIPRKRQKFHETDCTNDSSSAKITLKRDKINEPIGPIANIPRKKPKIIASEMIKIPLKRVLPKKDKIISVTDDCSKNIEKNENCLIDTGDFRATTKILENPNDKMKSNENVCTSTQRKFERNDDDRESRLPNKSEGLEIRKIENNEEKAKNDDTKNANKAVTTQMRNSSALHSKAAVDHSTLNLAMLQHKIAVNSKNLIDQANEMRQLSLFIDEMKQKMANSHTADVIANSEKPAAVKKPKKTFVSRSTQTIDPQPVIKNNSTSKIPSIVNIKAPELKNNKTINNSRDIKTSTERSILNQDWFLSTPRTKRKQNNERDIVKKKDDITQKCISSSANVINIKAPDRIMKISENQQKENSTLQNDQYYNPLRPRRWPNNRNNPKTVRNGNSTREPLKRFPPLPIIIETPKTKKRA